MSPTTENKPGNARPRLLKGDDLADLLQVSRSYAYTLLRRGDIPSVRLGRAVRVRPEDVEDFIQQNVCGVHGVELRGRR